MSLGRCPIGIYAVVLLAALAAQSMAAAAPEDHPLVARYPGSTLTKREAPGFSPYKVVVGLDQNGKTDDEIVKSSAVSGELTRLFYENPKDRSALEIFANYKEALQKAGFAVVFECGDKACGPSWASSRWGRVNGMRYVSSPMWYLAARRGKAGEETYVALAVTRLQHQIDVLQREAMERGLVTVTAESLRKGLAAEGRAVLDGILFDHDKATIKPESKPALAVIARFLAENPKLEVFIVGHTDSAGALDHNLQLSLARARAVVAALVADHGIAAARLSAHGVGPLSPAKTNRSAAGKAENRRVEMVERGS